MRWRGGGGGEGVRERGEEGDRQTDKHTDRQTDGRGAVLFLMLS